MNWDDYFFGICDVVKVKSKDPKTQVGCVIVGPNNEILSTGFNGLPMGVADHLTERYERPEKYAWIEHSERNSIYLAARRGTPLEGSTIYLTWMPCADCARGIIQSGIKHVKILRFHYDDVGNYPEFRFDVSMMMFKEANIDYNWVHSERKEKL
jgi:dCMP deaminase